MAGVELLSRFNTGPIATEQLASLLKGIAERSRGTISVNAILNRFWNGLQIWVIRDPTGNIRSCMSTSVETYPSSRCVLRVDFAAGEMKDLQELTQHFEAIAREHGCDAIEIEGRKGWERVLDGFHETSRTLTKELI